MTDTPTREPLVGLAERLRERMAAASEQPWVYRPDKYDDWGWIRGVERDDSDIGPFRPIVANAKDSLVRDENMAAHRRNGTDPYGPNALLIVEAVNALPDLLTALEEQSRRVEGHSGVTIINDFQRLAIEIVDRNRGEREIQIGFIPAAQCLSDSDECVSGLTLFPDDGSAPEIWVSDDTPVLGVPDVIFHELAHVLAGIEADHGEAWQAIYDRLWEEMHALCGARTALSPSDKVEKGEGA